MFIVCCFGCHAFLHHSHFSSSVFVLCTIQLYTPLTGNDNNVKSKRSIGLLSLLMASEKLFFPASHILFWKFFLFELHTSLYSFISSADQQYHRAIAGSMTTYEPAVQLLFPFLQLIIEGASHNGRLLFTTFTAA